MPSPKNTKNIFVIPDSEPKHEFAIKNGQIDLKLYKKILSRGLSCGIGTPNGKMCIEAAICTALGYSSISDTPKCVHPTLRSLKIQLNDRGLWTSSNARAQGLKELGIAQLGTWNHKDFRAEFENLFWPMYISIVVPELIHYAFPKLKSSGPSQFIKNRFGGPKSVKMIREIIKKCKVDKSFPAYHNAYNLILYGSCSQYRTVELNSVVRTINAGQNYKPMRGNKLLFLTCNVILKVLKKMKTPGCKLLKELEN